MRKVTILTLGFHPRALEFVILRKKPKVCYVIASGESLGHIDQSQGYKTSNLRVLKSAARKVNAKLEVYTCDPFDPESIGDALGKVLERLKPDDQVLINYSSGTQAMSLVLGSLAIVLSRIMPVEVLYSTKTEDGKEKIYNHTKVLKELFHKLYEIAPHIAG